ncbi:MAG: DUF4233 domain-containing protein [Microbacterium sp.]
MPPEFGGRYRTLTEKLGSIVLAFESVCVFLAGLTIFGLHKTPDGVPTWVAIVVGTVLAAITLAAAGTVRFRWGIWLGWAIQVIIALGALLLPAVLILALVFGGLWAYATIGGARVEARLDAQREAHSESQHGKAEH